MDPISKALLQDSGPKLVNGGFSARTAGLLAPFQPGQSGNPSGRKKKGQYTKLCEKLAKSPAGKRLLKSTMVAILEKQGMAAVLLMREIGERADGKVMQEIDVSGTIQTLTDEELGNKLKKLIA
jgi:hypothetical protein